MPNKQLHVDGVVIYVDTFAELNNPIPFQTICTQGSKYYRLTFERFHFSNYKDN